MSRMPFDRPRYDELRRGRRTLDLLAPLVQLGFLGLGLGIFLDQSRSLLSDVQFTWGERQVMGIIALLALGGCGFARLDRRPADQGGGRDCGRAWPTVPSPPGEPTS